MTNIEKTIQYLLREGEIKQEDIDNARKRVRNQINENPQGIHKQVRLLEDQAKVNLEQAEKEVEIKKRIDSGEITATTFSNLSAEEQQLTKLVLFKQYSPDQTNIPKALSAIEFMITSSLKFLDKAMDKSKLTIEEQATWDYLLSVMNKSDMPINTDTDWRYQYLDTQFTNTQNNRADYFQEKVNVTGSVE